MIDFDDAKDKVDIILRTDEQTRNCDNRLILEYWKQQGVNIQVSDDDLRKLTPASTIMRCRRHIQNVDGRLLPTLVGIIIQRRIREEAIINYFANNPKLLNQWQSLKYKVK